jgi:hypothetical protein
LLSPISRTSLSTVSGKVLGVPGTFGEIDIRLMGLNNRTDLTVRTIGGNYSFANIIPGKYRVIPQTEGGLVKYAPEFKDTVVINADVVMPDFVMTVIARYVISGKLINVGSGSYPVTLLDAGGKTIEIVNTDAEGNFIFSPHVPGSYTVVPGGAYWYCPDGRQAVELVDRNETVAFTAYGKYCYDLTSISYSPHDSLGQVRPGQYQDPDALISFSLSSCLNPTSVVWNFGDGSNEVSALTTQHVFTEEKDYTVTAKVIMCDKLTKKIVQVIKARCPPPMPPQLTFAPVNWGKIYNVLPTNPETWVIIDQCAIGVEPVAFYGSVPSGVCFSPIKTWSWMKNGSVVSSETGSHTFNLDTNDATIGLTVVDNNNLSASITKKISLIPCTPGFDAGSGITVKMGNDMVNGEQIYINKDPDTLKLNIGAQLTLTCDCRVVSIAYNWKVEYNTQPFLPKPLDPPITAPSFTMTTSKGWGRYKIMLEATIYTVAGDSIKYPFSRIIHLFLDAPDVKCPINGCRSAPQMCSDFYGEISMERLNNQSDLFTGTHAELVPAKGKGFANKFGFGSLDDGVMRSIRASGNFTLVARLENSAALSVNPNIQAGIMVRDNNSDFSRMVFIGYNNNDVRLLYRSKPYQDIAQHPTATSPNSDTWFKINRTGSTIKCYSSSDGSTWNGPFGIAGATEFIDWDRVVEIGLAAAGDNDDTTYLNAHFTDIKIISDDAALTRYNTIINTVFADGNLVSNWSFENLDAAITSEDTSWYDGHFDEASGSPAYEGHYYLHMLAAKPSNQSLTTQYFNTFFEKNGISATSVHVSFYVRSNAACAFTPVLEAVRRDTVSKVKNIPLDTCKIDTANKFKQYLTIKDIPDPSKYSRFRLQLIPKTAALSAKLDFDNVVVAPVFQGGSSAPVTNLTFADGCDQKFQTIQAADSEDVVASLILDDDGQTARTLPVFAKRKGASTDFHKVKIDPLADMNDYLSTPNDNQSWIGLDSNHGKIEYEKSPLNRVLAIRGRLKSLDIETEYAVGDTNAEPDKMRHRLAKTTSTSFDAFGQKQTSTDTTNANGYVIANEKSHYPVGGGRLVSTRSPDIMDWNWRSISPQGYDCDTASNQTCIKPTTYRYSTIGQVIRTQDPDAGLRQTLYDKLGNARLFVDGNKIASKQILVNMYDAFSRVTKTYIVEDPSGSRWTQEHADDPRWPENIAGFAGWSNLVLQTVYDTAPIAALLPVGVVDTMFKNVMGRVSARISTSAAARVGLFYSYDNRGNIATIWRQVPGVAVHKQEFVYNMAGQVTQRTNMATMPGATPTSFTKQEKYSYDALNRLYNVCDAGKKELTRFEYLPNGKISYKYIGSPATEPQRIKYTYDAADRLESMLSQIKRNDENWEKSEIWEQKLTYNDQGNICDQHYQLGPLSGVANPYRNVKYAYDFFNRLNMADYGSSTSASGWYDTASRADKEFDESILYNKDGAITDMSRADNVGAGSGQYTYYPNTHRVRSVSGSIMVGGKDRSNSDNYVYDDNGNMIIDRSLKEKIEYDYRNMPIKIIHYSDTLMTTIAKTVEFIYDADGNRVKKILTK